MKCDHCMDLCVRPHTLRPCMHLLCEPCIYNVTLCPVNGCGTPFESELMYELSNLIQRNYCRQYSTLDTSKTSANLLASAKQTSLDTLCSRKEKPMPKLLDRRYYLDFEATDRTPYQCRITQIGCVALNDAGEELCFNTYVKADQPMNEKASEITGITDSMLCHAPVCKDALLKFLEWVDKTRENHPVVLVAHNGRDYDFPLLMSEMWRWDMHPYSTLQRYGITKFRDSLPWGRINIPSHMLMKKESGDGSFRLGDLHESLVGHRFEGAHDALADCRALRAICECAYVKGKGFDQCEPDNHSYFELKRLVDDFQTKRESIDRTLKLRVKDKVDGTCRRALLSFFKPKPKSEGSKRKLEESNDTKNQIRDEDAKKQKTK